MSAVVRRLAGVPIGAMATGSGVVCATVVCVGEALVDRVAVFRPGVMRAVIRPTTRAA